MSDSFGDMVKQARKRLGWNQRDLAGRLEVGQQAVSNWERGSTYPSATMVRRAAELLSLDVNALSKPEPARASPGEVARVQRPVRPLVTRLPLHELQPDVFEQFSAELAAALHPAARVSRFGAQGHTQYGIDVIVHHPDGLPTGIQCKREQKFGPAKVKAAIDELKIDVGHCYLFLTRVATPQARQAIADHPSWTLWDIDDLSREVRSLPDRDAALRLVDTYFPGWRESFLGVPSPGPWLPPDDFFRPFLKGGIYSHDWELAGRVVELADLRAYAADPDRKERVAVVTGRGGIGKTRLLRAVAKELDAEEHVTVRFLATDVDVETRDFEVLPPDDGLLVIVDDAHDRTDTAAIIAGIRRFRPNAKVLVSLRPYGLAQLFTDLRSVGVHPSEVPKSELDDLTFEDAERLAQAILGADVEPQVATQLAVLAPDCPLLIVVGAALVARGTLHPARLEGSEDIRSEILRMFGAAVVDAPGTGETELRREVLKAVAALQPFRLNQPTFQEAASTLTGKPFDQVMPHLRALRDAGVLLQRGQSVRIVPDLLGDVLLAEAAVDGPSGASTGYLERVCGATSGETLAHAVVNAGRVDWQTRQLDNKSDSAVEVLWNALTAEYEAGEASSRRRILQAVRHVAAFQPVHAIALVRKALDDTPVTTEPVDPAILTANDDVTVDLPGILHRAAFGLDHLPEAADLLWEMARHDTRQPHQYPEHPVRLLAELTEYAVGKPVEFQYGMIASARRWLHDDDVAAHTHSPFAVLEPILATEAEQRRFDGLTMTLRAYPVNVEAVHPLRDLVVDMAFAEARKDDVRRAVRGVQALEAALRYPMGMFGRAISAEEHDHWAPMFLDILNRLAELAAHAGLDPAVAVAIRQAVHWHALYATGETAHPSQAVLSALPTDPEHRLAHVLHDMWGPSTRELDDYNEYSRKQEAHLADVAADVCRRWSPDEVIDRIVRRLILDGYAYGAAAAAPGPFMWTLVRDHAEVGAALVRRVVSDRSNSEAAELPALGVLRELVPVVLSVLTGSLPTQAMSLARALVDDPSIVDARAVAYAFGSGRGNRTTLLDGEADLLRELIVHGDPHVRRFAVSASRFLGDDNQELAMHLVTNVRFGDSSQLAAELASLLKTSGTVSWKHLTDTQKIDLLGQLHECPSIDDYHVTHLIAEMSTDRPEQILELLMRRVETYEHRPSPAGYKPLPHEWHRPLHFRDNRDFERFLRRTLDWIAGNLESWIRKTMGARIFAAVAQQYDEAVLRVLLDAITSADRGNVLAVGAVLDTAPRNFAWSHSGFVVEAVRAAEKLGDDCVRAIGGSLHSAAIRGVRMGTPGQPYQEDIEQRDKAAEVARTLPAGSIEHRFYLSLASSAEFRIEQDSNRDDVLDDPRTW
ncbi:helix-turn-helix domain-containing protein [Saccharothrix sp. BKS2]|uniref:helix-turn-helix domain-containing protein n=1 Tax=Saccharothrix sp. BKS2 TaxID=3064400 RepID=UPI0039EA11E7